MTKSLSLRLVLIAATLTVAVPSFASAVTPLCGGEKGQDEKKTDNKKETPPKKPTNPA